MRRTIVYFLLFCLAGCCKVYCDGTELMVSFEKFAASDTDSVYFISYVPASGQTQKVDSFLVTTPVLPAGTPSPVIQTLQSNYDWKVVLPSVNRQYLIQNFELTTEKCNCGGKRYKSIRSFLVNGVRKEGLFVALE